MADYFASPITLSGQSDVSLGQQQTGSVLIEGELSMAVAGVGTNPTPSGASTVVVNGLLISISDTGFQRTVRYVGEPNVPHDIKRQRRYTYEMMRRMGTPVIIKAMITDRDVHNGIAEPSANYDDIYGQTRNRDPLSFGTGFVSKEKSTWEWLDSNGHIVYANTGTPAPKYRGYWGGVLTWIIEPDAAEDFFKHTEQGVLIKVQTATAQAPWWPDINDNDLIIHTILDRRGNVRETQDRYHAKMTNPVSIRGLDRRGRREYSADYGNRHVVNQTFEMALLPRQHILYEVETDR